MNIRNFNLDSVHNLSIFDNTKTLIITSLSLVSALAWDSAFQKYFEKNKLLNKGGPWLYAIIVTIITMIFIYVLNKVK